MGLDVDAGLRRLPLLLEHEISQHEDVQAEPVTPERLAILYMAIMIMLSRR